MEQSFKRLAAALALMCIAAPLAAEDPMLAELFAEHGVEGTIVIRSIESGQSFIHNEVRANRRFSPASTFKITNTLIAVDEDVASGKDHPFKWDGQSRSIASWNRDQTLESAFKVSCVWCFQELASQVGAETYRQQLDRLNYGQLSDTFEETLFWLDNSLQISALEQIDFLQGVYQRDFPLSRHSYETLRQIMRVEQTAEFSLWAKTGWAARVEPQVGWYVGYVETKNDVWLFATNIELRDRQDLPKRQQLTRQALTIKGILD